MTEIKTLISQSDAIKIEPNVLKCFSLRQIYIIKKSVEDEKNSAPSQRSPGTNTFVEKTKTETKNHH